MAHHWKDLNGFEVLTFDCYGTLIDWEAGILAALRSATGVDARQDDDALLEAYAGYEAALEAGPWLPYREVLARALSAVCGDLGRAPTAEQADELGSSVADWRPFPDSVDALVRLRRRFRLGIITNCDDDLFEHSNEYLGRPFDWVITAQQARAYKPALSVFELALERIGRPRERILHVAQSLFHDHVPARSLGLSTAWINRRHDRPGFGATPAAAATPDLVAQDMATFADLVLARSQ